MVLMKVAEHFVKLYDCKKLAVHLGIARCSDFVDSLVEANPHIEPNEVAFRVMKACLAQYGIEVFCDQLTNFLETIPGWKAAAKSYVQAMCLQDPDECYSAASSLTSDDYNRGFYVSWVHFHHCSICS